MQYCDATIFSLCWHHKLLRRSSLRIWEKPTKKKPRWKLRRSRSVSWEATSSWVTFYSSLLCRFGMLDGSRHKTNFNFFSLYNIKQYKTITASHGMTNSEWRMKSDSRENGEKKHSSMLWKFLRQINFVFYTHPAMQSAQMLYLPCISHIAQKTEERWKMPDKSRPNLDTIHLSQSQTRLSQKSRRKILHKLFFHGRIMNLSYRLVALSTEHEHERELDCMMKDNSYEWKWKLFKLERVRCCGGVWNEEKEYQFLESH